MAIKVILFDFDGTIADTHDAFVEIVNELSEEFGYQPVNAEELERLKHLSSSEIIKQSKIPLVKIPFILNRVKLELSHKIQDLKPIKGMKSSLFQLKSQGYSLGIITSNTKDNVIAFLENNQLNALFDFIYSETTLFGKSRVINKVLWQNHLSPAEVIYIGDETRDIQASKKSQVKVVAVAWGFNSPEVLAKHQPDFLIYQAQELMGVMEKCDENKVLAGVRSRK